MDLDADEDVLELLQHARRIVDRAELPEAFSVPAFEKALELLSSKQPSTSMGVIVHPAAASPASGTELTSGGRSVLARRLGISEDATEYIYDAGPSELQLVLARSRLPSQKARATRTVALLYAAGRQAAYGDEWTSVEAIREQCRLFGVLDTANFAAALSAAGDALIMRGRGDKREVKVTRTGFEEAGRLVSEITGQ